MHIEARLQTGSAANFITPALSLACSLLISSALLAAMGMPVIPVYLEIAKGALGSRSALMDTLARATPLILCGLAVAVAFRSRLWNIGAEGQLYAGATAAVTLNQWISDFPPWVAIPLLFLAGAMAGGVVFLLAVQLKNRLNVDEVVTTLLSNFIIVLLVSLLLDGPLKDPMSMGWPQSLPIEDAFRLQPLNPGSQVTGALLMSLAMAAALWLYNQRTVWGFEGKVVGASPSAARFAGIPVPAVLARVAVLSGGLAGLAGVAEVLGPRGFLIADLSPGYGYTGIVIATLAQLHPLSVALVGVVVAAIYVGSDSMSHVVGISSYVADVILSLSLIAMLVATFFTHYRIRRA